MSKEFEDELRAQQTEGGHHLTQTERDDEIERIREHSKHQHPGIERPPELPPFPAGKAAGIAVVLLVLLLIAGAVTMAERLHHSQALARRPSRTPCQPLP